MAQWEHKLYSMADNSTAGINAAIAKHEKDGWQLAALGESAESLTLIFKRPKQALPYTIWEHNIIRLLNENVSKRQIYKEIEKAIESYSADGWEVAAIGSGVNEIFIIATRPAQQAI